MKHPVEHTNIYTLTDPRNGLVRYVGKANNVHQRFKAHLNKARKHQIHKERWISQLKKLGLKPIMNIIDTVHYSEWQFWETYWISQFRTWGFDLINYTSGGDGCTFANQTSFKEGQNGIPVLAINLKCEIIERFNSGKQAESKYGRSVGGVLNGKRKTAKGLIFIYENKYSKDYADQLIQKAKTFNYTINSGNFKKGEPSQRVKKVCMYSLEGELLKTFDSVKQANEFVGKYNGYMQFLCTRSKKHIYNNNIFKYET